MTDQPWWTRRPSRERANRFARDFASRSGTTVSTLAAWGRFPEPCNCGSTLCTGWAMGHQWEDAIVIEAGRRIGERSYTSLEDIRAAVAGQ